MTHFRYEAVPFPEMPYRQPDSAALRASLEAAADAMKRADDYAAARKAFFDLQEAQEEFETQFTLCYIRSSMDTTDAFYEE